MNRKEREPTDWDNLKGEFQSHDEMPEPECMLPANHRDMMRDERPRAEKPRAEKDGKEG